MPLTIGELREEFEDDVTEQTDMSPQGWVQVVKDDRVIRFYCPIRDINLTVRKHKRRHATIHTLDLEGTDPRLVVADGSEIDVSHGAEAFIYAIKAAQQWMWENKLKDAKLRGHHHKGLYVTVGCTYFEFLRLQEMFEFTTKEEAEEAAREMGLGIGYKGIAE